MPKRTTRLKRLKANEVSIPEPIKRMIEARGWHFPPTEEEIRQRLEALRRFAGAAKVAPEILYAIAMDTDPSRLGLTMKDLEELKRRAKKNASGSSQF